jgi:hypothetical protein
MKKTILSIVSVISFITIFSLASNAQVGLQMGYLNSTFKTKVDNTTSKSDRFNGLNAGLTYDYNFSISEHLGLQTGLLYSFIRHKENVEIDLLNTDYDKTMTYQYATLPIHVKGMLSIGNNGLSIFASVGPDIIFGIAAKEKAKGKMTGKDVNVSESLYGNNSKLKRFDLALGFGGGVQYNSIRLKLGYDLGLLDLNDADNSKLKRNHFNVSLGYLF